MNSKIRRADITQKSAEFHARALEAACSQHCMSIEYGEDGTLQLVKYYNDESGEFCKVSTQLNIVPF